MDYVRLDFLGHCPKESLSLIQILYNDGNSRPVLISRIFKYIC